jgi:hypothetical protein
LPALANSRQRVRLLPRAEVQADGAVLRAILQHVADQVAIGEAEDVVKVEASVVRVTAGMRAAEDGDGAAAAQEIAQGIGGLGSFRECADEHQVSIVRQFLEQVLEAGVADECDIMAFLPTPHADHLRHDAGHVSAHDTGEQCSRRAPGHHVDDPNAELFHAPCPKVMERNAGIS